MTDRLEQRVDEMRSDTEAAGLTAAERAQLWQRVSASTHHDRGVWGPRIAWGAVAAGAAAAVLWWGVFRPAGDWYEVVAGGGCLAAVGDRLDIESGCGSSVRITVLADGSRDAITMTAGTTLAREHRALRLVRGEGRFDVTPRQGQGDVFEVRVSHGIIRVLGTSFSVSQGELGGSLELHRGRVEFVWRESGEREVVEAGQRLRWPKPSPQTEHAREPETTAETTEGSLPVERSTAPTGTRKHGVRGPRSEPLPDVEKPPPVDRVVERLFLLRSQKRFEEAIALLREASGEVRYAPEQRARFLYEMGRLLAHRGDRVAACQAWRTYLTRYPQGPQTEELAGLVRDCQATK